MNSWTLQNVNVVNVDEPVIKRHIAVRGSMIEAMDEVQGHVIDASNLYCMPGFIDMHIHGAAGADVMDASAEALYTMAKAVVKEGTTSFLATTMTQSFEAIEAALRTVATYEQQREAAQLLGIHLEGPFISKKQAGAQPIEYIHRPSKALLKKWLALSGNRIREITLAPEENIDVVSYARALGMIVSIGHSDASASVVTKAIEQGVTQATHLYNQMRAMHHRDAGVVGSVLLHRDVFVELIADFIHIHPQMIDLAYRLKGASRIILITDSMRAKGLSHGLYELGGQRVHVGDDGARLESGALAGSVLKMNEALRNMREATGASWQELTRMSSYNAAQQLNLPNKGYIAKGKDADFVIVDEQFNVKMTVVQGSIVYARLGGMHIG